MKKWIKMLIALPLVVVAEDEYRGKFTPDAEYVLSGKLAADLPPLPDVKFSLDAPAFREDLLSEVPEVGIHPRVVLSPSDIEEIKANIRKGDAADVTFRVAFRELRNKAAQPKPRRQDFGYAPWAGVSEVGAKGLLALLTDDKALGREAAEWTVKHAQFLEPRTDLLNSLPEAQSFKDNFYYFSRADVKVGGIEYTTAYYLGGAEKIAELAAQSVEIIARDNQYAFTSLGAEYDYAYEFMTKEERDYVRKVISKSTYGKYSTGMEIPGHFFINNHMSMGAEFYSLLLSIEGEEGFDARAAEQFVPRLMDKMTYDISPDGILYENVKGFIPLHPIYAAGRRGGRNHLKHDHLRAMFTAKAYASENIHNRYFGRGRNRPGINRNPAVGEGDKDPRFWILGADSGPGGHASFVWGWVLKRYFPEDPIIDYCYKINLQTANFDLFDGSDDETNYGGKIHYNTRNLIDLMLLCATDGMRDENGTLIDYQKSGPPEVIKQMPMVWKDMWRGIARLRSGWEKDDMVISYECRSDVYYGGHETPEQGDFRFSADGVLWSPYTGAYMDAYFRNMVLVDGYAGVYQPTPGKMVEVANTAEAATIVSDATDAYSWKKHEKDFYLWHDMNGNPDAFTSMFRTGAFRMNRDWELPFQPHMKEFYKGFAHLDWGPWHGETRGPEYYERWNDMEYVYRTLHMARGERPYMLIVDDLRKDDNPHQYDWNFMLPGDVRLYKANSAAKNRQLIKGTEGAIGTDLILCLGDAKQVRKEVGVFGGSIPGIELHPKEGDPMLLVRVLWRNTSFPYPLPSFEQAWKFNRIKIPAFAKEPEFKVLIYPYRFGEPLPFTKWSDDRSQLEISFDGQKDLYTFDRGEGNRTMFAMERNGKTITTLQPRPMQPVLNKSFGHTPDRNLPEAEQGKRTLLFDQQVSIAFMAPAPGCEIRYTLDGSEPTAKSTLYTEVIKVSKACTIKAVTVHYGWPFENNVSASTAVTCRKVAPAKAIAGETSKIPGLACELFSVHHTIFEAETGVFTGEKNMIPELKDAQRIAHVETDGFAVPNIRALAPKSEMHKGYYRYRGYFNAEETGVYRFRIYSCGPLQMTVGGQQVIQVLKPYGLSQKNRFGECVLEKGLHPIEFIVCDPVFWKGEMEPLMDLRVAVQAPRENGFVSVPQEWLSRDEALALESVENLETVVKAKPVKEKNLTPGLVEEKFDWSDRVNSESATYIDNFAEYKVPSDGLDQEFFAGLKKRKPFLRRAVWSLPQNDTLDCLVRLSGFLKVSEEGLYAFRSDAEGANQLTVGGELVSANGIQGMKAADKIHLKPGLYPLELVSAIGGGQLWMKGPNSDTFAVLVPGQLLHKENYQALEDQRPAMATVDFEEIKDGILTVKADQGIEARLYGATPVKTPFGQGIEFHGETARLELHGFHLAESACTVSMWMKRGESGEGYAFQAKPNKFYARLRRHDTVWAGYYRSPDLVQINAGKKAVDKEWFHLAVSYGDRVKVYVDGKLVGSQIVDRSAMYHGSGPYASYFTFMDGEEGGQVDNIKVYNRVLSAEEIPDLAR